MCVTLSNLVVLLQRVYTQKWQLTPKLSALGPRPIGVGPWLTPANTPLPTCYSVEFGRSRSNGTSVIKEIRVKFLTPRVPPFKVTQGHRHRHL